MKRFGEYDLKRLSDSRLLYKMNPPKFTYIFTAIVVIILVGLLVWSSAAIRAEQIQTSGIITTENKEVVFTEISGTISKIHCKEGDIMTAGDILMEFDKTEIGLQISKLENQVDLLDKRIYHIDTMLDAINDPPDASDMQPFQNSGDELEFYVMYSSYIQSYNAAIDDSGKISVNNQTRSALLTERNTCMSNRTNTESDLVAYNTSLSKYDIKATGSGYIHMDIVAKTGIVLQAGTQIGSISDPADKRIIEMYIPSGERSKIDAGQECSFVVDGLAQTEYGSVKGNIVSISSDAVVQDGGAYFKVVAEFDAEYVEDSGGGRINLSNGMTAKVWVTYEKVTYLKHWTEQLGIDKYL